MLKSGSGVSGLADQSCDQRMDAGLKQMVDSMGISSGGTDGSLLDTDSPSLFTDSVSEEERWSESMRFIQRCMMNVVDKNDLQTKRTSRRRS